MEQHSWTSPKIEIRESSLGGKGMFAKEHIGRDEKVFIWRTGYANRAGAEKAKQEGKLVIQWDDDLFSVEDRGDDVGYFINHSCDSNAWMQDAYTLIARRDIAAEEEVTADYSLWESGDYVAKWECRCGTPVCRKTITGNDWRLPDVQKRYSGHFSPLINKLIAKQRF